MSALKLSALGGATRPAILDALNAGLSHLSYVGHGGAAVWASENVWNSWDAASLQAQSEQPLLVTMNCLNGYFVAPAFESLSESLLKAEGRGAVASFSPSGLSLDGPAHQYHRALMAELTSGRHARLGDAVLAAQAAYAETGLMPELLSVYHLLGDPAMSIRLTASLVRTSVASPGVVAPIYSNGKHLVVAHVLHIHPWGGLCLVPVTS